MPEDINKLQKFIDNCKNCKFATCEQCEISYTEVKAIENLIARYKELEKENGNMKALLKIQASIAKELEFDTPDKMTRFRGSYYVPDTMTVRDNIGQPKRLELSYVDVSKLLED